MKGSDTAKRLTIHLCGPFRILDQNEDNVAPKGMKAQGLLALIATSPSKSRSRIWLQDKLWSDRGKDQGSSSLRQALSEIRRSFGDASGLLTADRRTVSLNMDRVSIAPEDKNEVFLEGLDVRDQEFESWLVVERMQRAVPNGAMVNTPALHSQMAEKRPAPCVAFSHSQELSGDLRPIEEAFVDGASRTAREMLGVDTAISDTQDDSKAAVRVFVRCFKIDQQSIALRVSATNTQTGMLVWSGMSQVAMKGALPLGEVCFLRLGNEMVEALAEYFSISTKLAPEQSDASGLLWLGLRHLFSMTDQGALEADKYFEQAHQLDPRGLFLAWRSHLRGIQIVERHNVDKLATKDEGLHFAEQAYQTDPMNACTVAALANARLILDENVTICDELSRRSVELNPANPMGWWSRSAAHLYGKDYEAAYQCSRLASALAGSSPHKFWWDINRALTSSVTGRHSEALDRARRAHVLAPNFKPPLRALLVLQTICNDLEGARKSAEKLAKLEPDFEIDRLANDPSYPVSLFRSAGLITSDMMNQLK